MSDPFRHLRTAGHLLLVASFAAVLACSGPGPSDYACGNGSVGSEEECDDGNSDSGDGCSDECQHEDCGNGSVGSEEECDDGNASNNDACRNNCTLAECVADLDCGDPAEICLATRCRPGCRSNADCTMGENCQRYVCVPGCTSDASCAADEVCRMSDGTCVKGCRSDAACAASTGDPATICHRGLQGPAFPTELACSCASQCFGSQICLGHCANASAYSSEGSCKKGCRDNSQCAPEKTCSAYGECLDPCTTDADCCGRNFGNSGSSCVAGACVDACSTNEDCGLGTVCSAGTCVAGCLGDSGCDPGQVCNGGTCSDPLCGVGSKCVFATAADLAPNFNGALGADAACQAAANAGSVAVQGLVFKAWISDNSSSPLARFTQATVPYKLLDGTTIATDWADLTDGSIASLIDLDEHGASRVREGWTNTLPTGAADNGAVNPEVDSCGNWTSLFGNASIGRAGTFTNSAWAGGASLGCTSSVALYCFQQ